MGSEAKSAKVWIRFESKKQNGEIVKLRIQDLPSNRMDDFVIFYTTYFIKDEAFHKAAGIFKNPKAIEEYKIALTSMFGLQPPHISICCLDKDSENFDKIFAISTVQLTSKDIDVDEVFRELGIVFETPEMNAMICILKTMDPIFPKPVKEKYKSFHEGRGIIVHPDYRGLGIASQIVKQRRLLLKEYNVPMTCAWMTSMGSQKAAERDGWETLAEVTLEELDKITGLFFVKDVPTFKLMVATLDC